ncbi:MAG: exodeoxyribonuclease VII large subunit [Elusimicrobiota bacterium]
MPTKKIYTISEINNIASSLLEEKFSSIWIEGEISRLTLHSSGHMYFTLKDSGCAIDAVMFKGARLKSKLAFKPERGLKVLIKGKLSIFPPQGRYQLIVWEMKEQGAGDLEEKFQRLKKKLLKEGLFDKKYKKKFPFIPQLIGIVTSPTGAAVRDILNVVKRRFSNVDIVIFPARVQGNSAAGEIVEGIRTLNKNYPNMDAMIVGRGGGSLEDLWPFNEEIVARAVFESAIPVISAVGHEIDFTISDFAADLRAPTPSAAAELIVKNKEDLVIQIEKLNRLMNDSVNNKIRILTSSLTSISSSGIFLRPYKIVQDREQQLDYVSESLSRALDHLLELKNHRLSSLDREINSLSPKRTLARGYTITSAVKGDKLIKGPDECSKGMKIKTMFSEGSVTSQVVEK